MSNADARPQTVTSCSIEGTLYASPSPAQKTQSINLTQKRSYSGTFGEGGGGGGDLNNGRGIRGENYGPNGNLLPFELTRNVNTEWLFDDARHPGKLIPLLLAYLSCIMIGQMCMLLIFPPSISWTVTNALHGFVTMMYLHWIKGSPDFLEPGGEMNGMTLWEQLDAVAVPPGKAFGGRGEKALTNQKFVLLFVPTLLCHAGCHFAQYGKASSLVNVVIWSICIIAKMPFMHGVRLLGINRTAGIDDDVQKQR